MNVFVASIKEMMDRFDPKFVAFSRRVTAFRCPGVRMLELLSEAPEYGAGEAGVERVAFEQPRYVRITDIDENGELISGFGVTVKNVDASYFLRDNDMLFARSGNTVGKTYLHDTGRVKESCIYAGYMIRFRFNDKVLPKYVFCFSQTPYYHEWTQAVQRSAGQPNINAQEYCRLVIPLPPLPEQQKIVDEFDAEYATKRAADEKAKRLLASIDDMVLKELGIAKLPSPDTSLAARVFTVPLKETVGDRLDAIAYQPMRMGFYRNVRSGKYRVVDLGSLVEVRREQTDEISSQVYVGLENINSEDGSYCGVDEKESCSSAMVFSKGQILFPKLRPYLNKVWLAEFDGVASTEFVAMQAIGISAEYLTAFLRMRAVADTMGVLMTGNTLPRVQQKDILALPIPVPPKPVQERIAAQASAILSEARKLKFESAVVLAAAKRRIESRIIERKVST